MAETPTETIIKEFLLTEILYDKKLRDLDADESLLEKGLLDSLAILRVVSFCEEQFGVSIPDDEVLPENLESVRAIAALVDRCRSVSR